MRCVALLVVLALAACNGDRDEDCARVKAAITAANESAALKLPELTVAGRLRNMVFRDREVADAVKAMIDETGWTAYTPYSGEKPAAPAAVSDRLAKLCHL